MDREYLISLIKNAGEMAPAKLTAAEREFLNKSWDNRADDEKALFYEAWREMPGTIEHAAASLTAESIKGAASVISAMISTMLNNGAANIEIETITITELLAVLEYEASRHQDGAQAE
jgi:hypothetical protein